MQAAVAAALTVVELLEQEVLAVVLMAQQTMLPHLTRRLTQVAVVAVAVGLHPQALAATVATAVLASSSSNTKSLQPQRSLPLSPRKSG